VESTARFARGASAKTWIAQSSAFRPASEGGPPWRVETERVPVLLLDEPFADLDDAGAIRLRETIVGAREDGRSVVVATHAHPELDKLAMAQIAIDDGVATAA